jgi:hemerythrin superfamily protein
MELVAALLEDHEEIRSLFDKVGTGPRREERFDHLRERLVRHEVAEEAIVRPLTKRYAADGERVAQARVNEESNAEAILKEMEGTEMGSARWDRLFERLHTAVLRHADKEESVEFPRLQANVDPAELTKRGTMFATAKRLAPTHPHPMTPNSPAATMLLGPIAGVIDRARDAVTKALST